MKNPYGMLERSWKSFQWSHVLKILNNLNNSSSESSKVLVSDCMPLWCWQRGEMLLAMEDYAMATKINPQKTESLFRHGLHYFNNK